MDTPGIGVGISSERPPTPKDESTKTEEPKASTEELKLPPEAPPPQETPEMVIEEAQPVGQENIQVDTQPQEVSNLTVTDLEAPVIDNQGASKLQQEILNAANE